MKAVKDPDVLVQHMREHDDHPRVVSYVQHLSRARDEATKAYNSGEPRSSCPYPRRSLRRREWLKTWDQCSKKDKGEENA